MESKTIVIGSKSRYGRGPKGGNENASFRAQPISNPRPEKVDVYVGDTFVREMLLRTLRRFSRVAALALPPLWKDGYQHPKNSKEANHAGACAGLPIDDPNPGETLDGIKASAQLPQGKEKDHRGGDTAAPNASSSPDTLSRKMEDISGGFPGPGPIASEPQKKILTLSLPGASAQPRIESVQHCLRWIDLNKHATNQERPSAFHIPHAGTVGLAHLVNIYAAALCLQLRPFPRALCGQLMDFLTTRPPTADQLRYVWHQLPHGDVIVTRAITSCCEHLARNGYRDAEAAAIWDFSCATDELRTRFDDVTRSLQARWRRARRARAAAGNRKSGVASVTDGVDKMSLGGKPVGGDVIQGSNVRGGEGPDQIQRKPRHGQMAPKDSGSNVKPKSNADVDCGTTPKTVDAEGAQAA